MPGSQFRGFLTDRVEQGRGGKERIRWPTPVPPRTFDSGSAVTLPYPAWTTRGQRSTALLSPRKGMEF